MISTQKRSSFVFGAVNANCHDSHWDTHRCLSSFIIRGLSALTHNSALITVVTYRSMWAVYTVAAGDNSKKRVNFIKELARALTMSISSPSKSRPWRRAGLMDILILSAYFVDSNTAIVPADLKSLYKSCPSEKKQTVTLTSGSGRLYGNYTQD